MEIFSIIGCNCVILGLFAIFLVLNHKYFHITCLSCVPHSILVRLTPSLVARLDLPPDYYELFAEELAVEPPTYEELFPDIEETEL